MEDQGYISLSKTLADGGPHDPRAQTPPRLFIWR